MDEPDLDSAGGRLRWARAQAGFENAAEFAKRHGYNPTTYRAYENNQNAFAKLAHEFADKLGVPARWLMKGGDLERASEGRDGAFEQQAKEIQPSHARVSSQPM